MMTNEERERWLAERRTGLSGTDVAKVAGLSKWGTPLDVWYEKRGLAAPKAETPAMMWGRLQEQLIADYYAREHGVELYEPGLIRHPEHEYFIGTPDRLFKDGRPEVLEIKTASRRSEKDWGEAGSSNIPDDYYIQIQWYMALLGFTTARVAAKIDSSDYREYEIAANAQLISKLQERAEDFWKRCVVGGERPEATGAGAFGSKYLDSIKDDGLMLTFDGPGEELAARYAEAKRESDEAEARMKAVRAELEALIGEASGIENEHYKITWKMSKGRSVTDAAGVADHIVAKLSELGLLDKLGETYDQIKARFTKTQPGSRRFLFKTLEG